MNGLDRRGTDRDRTRELDKYGYVEVDRGFDEGYPDGESRDAAFMDVGDPSGAAAKESGLTAASVTPAG